MPLTLLCSFVVVSVSGSSPVQRPVSGALYVPLTKHAASRDQAIICFPSISSTRTWAQWGQGLRRLQLQNLIKEWLLNLCTIPASVIEIESQRRVWVRMLDALGIQNAGSVDLSDQAAFLTQCYSPGLTERVSSHLRKRLITGKGGHCSELWTEGTSVAESRGFLFETSCHI